MNWTEDYYHTPTLCAKCGGVMIYQGVGEYSCEKCNATEYDDYGRVRNYLEKNGGATAAQIENALGIPQKTIRQMLKESRLEITEGSASFLHCELCGKNIRSGRFCNECEMKIHRNMEENTRRKIQGYSTQNKVSDGKRRFVHDE